ncbi:MAG: hypothetical protein VCE74_21745, partial [Alphaproteobacteria bacterium]
IANRDAVAELHHLDACKRTHDEPILQLLFSYYEPQARRLGKSRPLVDVIPAGMLRRNANEKYRRGTP